MAGTLMVKSTVEALTDADGNPVTATKSFTAHGASGSVELEFAFDGSLLADEDVVAFESLRSEGIEVAAHADIDDGGQTIRFLDIRTTATDKADGDKVVSGGSATIVDEVAYEGLEPGAEYTLTATLMDAETGEAVTTGESPSATEVTATATFAPAAADGSQPVEIGVDLVGLDGKRLVVFEKLARDGVQQATHKDLSDGGQTVTVDGPETPETPETPDETTGEKLDKTGVDLMPYAIGATAVLALAIGLTLYGIRRIERSYAPADGEGENPDDE